MSFSIVLTAECIDEVQLLEVKEVLEIIPGSYLTYHTPQKNKHSFIPAPPQNEALSEPEFFEWMNQYRVSLGNKIRPDDILVVLTSREIANHHFNGIDFEKRNIFVDLKNWRQVYLPDSPPKYPIAFHVFLSILLAIYCKDFDEAIDFIHLNDKGCILDFNAQKNNVVLKVLTARICPICIDKFLAINPDTNLLAFFRAGFEKIRHDMVEGEYYQKIKPTPMRLIFKKNHTFYFEGVGALDLDPAHTLVYLYFLKTKEKPTYLNEIKNDVEFLDMLIRELKGKDKQEENEKFSPLVVKLCGLKYDGNHLVEKRNNAMSERISRVNKEITRLLGTFGLQAHFQIQNLNGRHGVSKEIKFNDETGLINRCEIMVAKEKKSTTAISKRKDFHE